MNEVEGELQERHYMFFIFMPKSSESFMDP